MLGGVPLTALTLPVDREELGDEVQCGVVAAARDQLSVSRGIEGADAVVAMKC